jgi:hypothetical protein
MPSRQEKYVQMIRTSYGGTQLAALEWIALWLRCVLRISVACAAFLGAGCDSRRPVYTADPITAWVVDKDSGTPLAGVNVVAAWELKGGLEGGNTVGFLKVMETMTDASGKFEFPGWGPLRNEKSGLLRDATPEFLLFKSGYRFYGVGQPAIIDVAPAHLQSYWNGKQIPLQRFDGSLDEYSRDLSLYLGTTISTLLSKDDCTWKYIPKFLAAADRQNQIFMANRTHGNLGGLQYWNTAYAGNCGSLKQYVEEHGK